MLTFNFLLKICMKKMSGHKWPLPSETEKLDPRKQIYYLD